MRRYVQTHVEDEIADLLIRGYGQSISAVNIDVPADTSQEDAPLSICLSYYADTLGDAETGVSKV